MLIKLKYQLLTQIDTKQGLINSCLKIFENINYVESVS